MLVFLRFNAHIERCIDSLSLCLLGIKLCCPRHFSRSIHCLIGYNNSCTPSLLCIITRQLRSQGWKLLIFVANRSSLFPLHFSPPRIWQKSITNRRIAFNWFVFPLSKEPFPIPRRPKRYSSTSQSSRCYSLALLPTNLSSLVPSKNRPLVLSHLAPSTLVTIFIWQKRTAPHASQTLDLSLLSTSTSAELLL